MFAARVSILVFSAAVAVGQPADDSVPLLRDAVELARTAHSWRAEGTLSEETVGTGLHSTAENKFRIAFQLARQARMEITEGAAPQLRVCDGTAQWTYYPQRKQYSKVASPRIIPCAYPMNEWPLLLTLQRAELAGTDVVTVDGQPRQCQLVHGDFGYAGATGRSDSRTLCIDPASKLIWRYRVEHVTPEGTRTVSVYTFTSIERDAQLSADLFRFDPPEGATQTGSNTGFVPPAAVAPLPSLPDGVYRIGGGVSAPTVIFKKEPEYTKEARRAHYQGTVVLQVVISPEGEATNIRVIRSLGMGLDEKAIEAVRQWKFRPGMKDGKPVAVAAQIEINFRLLDNPPDEKN